MDVVDSLGVINSLVAVRLGRLTFGGNKLFYFIISQEKLFSFSPSRHLFKRIKHNRRRIILVYILYRLV